MARILLNSPAARSPRASAGTQRQSTQLQGTSLHLDTTQSTPSTSHLSPAAIEARLRERRTPAYVEAVTRLDAGVHVPNAQAVQALMEAIRQELPELSLDQLPLGIVSRCYLGDPYEVHTLDRDGMIIQHYKRWESLPDVLERARALSLHPGYVFIEVYSDKLIAVTASGETSIVTR